MLLVDSLLSLASFQESSQSAESLVNLLVNLQKCRQRFVCLFLRQLLTGLARKGAQQKSLASTAAFSAAAFSAAAFSAAAFSAAAFSAAAFSAATFLAAAFSAAAFLAEACGMPPQAGLAPDRAG